MAWDINRENRALLERALVEALTPREELIMRHFLDMPSSWSGRSQTPTLLGMRLQITRERVYQIRQKAIKKLGDNLAPELDGECA